MHLRIKTIKMKIVPTGMWAWLLTCARLKQEQNLMQVRLTEVHVIACQLQLPLQHQEEGTPGWEK